MLGFVVGLAAEARIALRFGYHVQVGGGTPEGAGIAANLLVQRGASALVSFGLAGGLDPALRPGAVIVPAEVLADGERLGADARLGELFGGLTGHTMLAGSEVVASAAEKRRLRAASGADAVDLESGAVVQVALAHGLPFVVVRAICDPAERGLPPVALIALDRTGGIGLASVMLSVLRQPRQLPGLLRLAWDALVARRALVRLLRRSVSRLSPS